MKTTFSFALLLAAISACGQTGYYVDLEATHVRMYLGYTNLAAFYIAHPADTFTYKFKAVAEGATIDFDDNGKTIVLPTQKTGVLRFYAERGGKIYKVEGDITFEGLPAPVNDETFIKVMGITKEHPGTSIANPRTFSPPPAKELLSAGLYIKGSSLSSFESGPNKINVFVAKRDGELLRDQAGDIQVESADAVCKKLGNHTFEVIPAKNLHHVNVVVRLDGVKVGEQMVGVRIQEQGAGRK